MQVLHFEAYYLWLKSVERKQNYFNRCTVFSNEEKC